MQGESLRVKYETFWTAQEERHRRERKGGKSEKKKQIVGNKRDV